MNEMKQWIAEHIKRRCFVLTAFMSLVALAGLTMEFVAFSYGPIKIVRYLILLTGMFFIAWHDGETHRIPNWIILLLASVRTILLLMECLMYQQVWLTVVISAFTGFIVGTVLMGTCYLLSRGGIGAGDVKLFMVIGYYLGTNGIIGTLFLASVIAMIICLILLLFKKINMKQSIPFGPFIYLGMLLACFLGI